MREQVVDVILQFGPPHFSLGDLLVGGELDLFFAAIDFVVEPVILVLEVLEVRIDLEAYDSVTVFRELTEDRMMQVHGMISWLRFD